MKEKCKVNWCNGEDYTCEECKASDNANYTKLCEELERLKRMEKNPKPYLPYTWREDLPVIPIRNVIKFLEYFKASQKKGEEKCLCCEGRCDCEYGCNHPHETTYNKDCKKLEGEE